MGGKLGQEDVFGPGFCFFHRRHDLVFNTMRTIEFTLSLVSFLEKKSVLDFYPENISVPPPPACP